MANASVCWNRSHNTDRPAFVHRFTLFPAKQQHALYAVYAKLWHTEPLETAKMEEGISENYVLFSIMRKLNIYSPISYCIKLPGLKAGEYNWALLCRANAAARAE